MLVKTGVVKCMLLSFSMEWEGGFDEGPLDAYKNLLIKEVN